MAQDKHNTINIYVQLNISKPFKYLQFSRFPVKEDKRKSLCKAYRQFLIVYASSFCCWVYTVMETTSNPWSVGKP